MTHKTLTQADLAAAIAQQLNLHNTEAKAVVALLLETMRDAIIDDHKLLLSNFGTFTIKAKEPRPGRNFKTGQQMMMSGLNTVRFKSALALKNEIKIRSNPNKL